VIALGPALAAFVCAASLQAGMSATAAQTSQPAASAPAASRADLLQQQREEKSRNLKPYEQGTLEKWAVKVENERIFQKLLEPRLVGGYYTRINSVTTGGGLAFGPGYKLYDLFGGHADLNVWTAASLKKYWALEGAINFKRIAGDTLFGKVWGRRRDFPQEDYFGLGPDSRRPDRVSFGYRETAFGGSGGVNLTPWLAVGSQVEFLSPGIGRGRDPRFPSIERIFTDVTAPGLAIQPDYLRSELFADLNYSEPRGNPRKGGRYIVSWNRFSDRDVDRYAFRRLEFDLRQYLGILQERRVLVLRSVVSLSEPFAGHTIPFYMQKTLGGSNTLRGFREYRFRDENLLLFQAEYRYEIFPALDGALFYDAGKVAHTREGLGLRGLESDYGFGFRFGTMEGVFLRVDVAFGSRDGKRYFLKMSHEF
jgi:hypothetical protein